MASGIPNSFWNDLAKGNIDVDTDTFKRLLVTAIPAIETFKDSWAKRSDVTNEHAATGGYVAGGEALTATVPAIDTANNRQDLTWGSSTWTPNKTLSALGSIVYKARGGAATADELCFLNDFAGTVSVTNGTLTHNADTTRIAN